MTHKKTHKQTSTIPIEHSAAITSHCQRAEENVQWHSQLPASKQIMLQHARNSLYIQMEDNRISKQIICPATWMDKKESKDQENTLEHQLKMAAYFVDTEK